MLIHRGKILENFIKDRVPKVSIAALARNIGYDRTTVYQHFGNDNLDYSIILKYGKALNHDFSREFPEMMDFMSSKQEPLTEYNIMTTAEALQERDYWKDKYIGLMERYNELILSQLKSKE